MISIFGASVTQQKNGYAVQLRKILNERIEIHGYGGMHLNNGAICYLSDASKNHPEYCLIDWFTTGYSMCSEETDAYIDTIIYHFSVMQCKTIFLFLPYRNSPEKKSFYAHCQKALGKRSIAYIDISHLMGSSDIELYLRDSIHTTDLGSHKYAQLIAEKFLKLKDTVQIDLTCTKTKYNNICKVVVKREFSNQLILVGNCEIIGLLLTIGPHSGKVLISSATKQQVVNTWDRWCHYPRLHFNLETSVRGEITFQILRDSFDTSSCNVSMEFSKIPKKLIVHRIYYIGETLSLMNACDGKRIILLKIFLGTFSGRIRQKFKKIAKLVKSKVSMK